MLCHVNGGYVINIKYKPTEFNSSLMSLNYNLENTIPSLIHINWLLRILVSTWFSHFMVNFCSKYSCILERKNTIHISAHGVNLGAT